MRVAVCPFEINNLGVVVDCVAAMEPNTGRVEIDGRTEEPHLVGRSRPHSWETPGCALGH